MKNVFYKHFTPILPPETKRYLTLFVCEDFSDSFADALIDAAKNDEITADYNWEEDNSLEVILFSKSTLDPRFGIDLVLTFDRYDEKLQVNAEWNYVNENYNLIPVGDLPPEVVEDLSYLAENVASRMNQKIRNILALYIGNFQNFQEGPNGQLMLPL